MSVDQGTKREDCIGWDDYFMGFAVLAAKRSKDPGRSPWSLAIAVRPKYLTLHCLDVAFPCEFGYFDFYQIFSGSRWQCRRDPGNI